MTAPWRVFFALVPGPRARARLHGLAAALAARQPARIVPPANLHLTLLFVGQVAPDRLDSLVQIGRHAAAKAAPMALAITRVGWFREAAVVWAGPSAQPLEVLTALHDELVRGCRAAGLPCDRRALAPHLTLLRKARCEPAAHQTAVDPPIAMPVRRLVLMRSISEAGGVRYRPLAGWPLAGAPGGA